MIKALLLILTPLTAWDSAAQRSLRFTVLLYLLPMMLIVGAVEGYGLVEWGRWQSEMIGIKKFASGEAILSEAGQMLFMTLIILISAYFIRALGETFHLRNTYTQALTVVIYGLSPVFLLRLFDVIPNMTLWVPWLIGIMLSAKILYYGVPRVMQPDPPHALGLYFMSVLLLAMVTAAERYISIGYLTGKFIPLSEAVSHIAVKLHLMK
ncbi:MAG TPA: YIP1 family protein [Methylomirabilota bacterium]|nr:YIP1 family protein [Methylomirabilota bacterium]